MSWEKELEELARRKALAAQMGGAEKVARHKAQGRLTVRERIDALVDAGSFHEIGSIAGKASYDAEGNISGFVPANLVMGRARIDGRPVAVAGDDWPTPRSAASWSPSSAWRRTCASRSCAWWTARAAAAR